MSVVLKALFGREKNHAFGIMVEWCEWQAAGQTIGCFANSYTRDASIPQMGPAVTPGRVTKHTRESRFIVRMMKPDIAPQKNGCNYVAELSRPRTVNLILVLPRTDQELKVPSPWCCGFCGNS